MKLWTALAAIALTLMSAEAHAGNWSGCYIGAHAGAGIADTQASIGGLSADGLGSQGAIGGLHIGCDLQVPESPIVVGAFGDYTWSSAEFKVDPGILKATLDDSWAVGARAGVAIGNALPYILAGWTQSKSSIQALGTSIASHDFSGWFGGAGIELRFEQMPNLTLGLEYRYVQFDSETIGGLVKLEPDEHQAMLRANWRFDLNGLLNK
jgi:outer membrane immunogenic protein